MRPIRVASLLSCVASAWCLPVMLTRLLDATASRPAVPSDDTAGCRCAGHQPIASNPSQLVLVALPWFAFHLLVVAVRLRCFAGGVEIACVGSVRLRSFDDFPLLLDRKLRHCDRKQQRELAGCKVPSLELKVCQLLEEATYEDEEVETRTIFLYSGGL
ncbi:hypothetical protein KFK09_003403 [Dendrobium nobile]|uniref:Secreted protein n=1 Tax=Dendrobium nobile TaxID=94219 RepID=A0A8T3BXQ9_DENNO|nr:hypothetical protein KFK09_003403 [Dendrobium nobile]